jgi:hypothetical protein
MRSSSSNHPSIARIVRRGTLALCAVALSSCVPIKTSTRTYLVASEPLRRDQRRDAEHDTADATATVEADTVIVRVRIGRACVATWADKVTERTEIERSASRWIALEGAAAGTAAMSGFVLWTGSLMCAGDCDTRSKGERAAGAALGVTAAALVVTMLVDVARQRDTVRTSARVVPREASYACGEDTPAGHVVALVDSKGVAIAQRLDDQGTATFSLATLPAKLDQPARYRLRLDDLDVGVVDVPAPQAPLRGGAMPLLRHSARCPFHTLHPLCLSHGAARSHAPARCGRPRADRVPT